ncbi:hypothetical protein GCM10011512_28150 [Tersicoccus solisilvae]|uniref:Uncharacterized protein n=1 Tax=Tersicoccus solisilvae TaxID=1882339 RepID=A0ABQ1PMD8_9MICC|nr:hypothetical protein [Tersicoccus solisilvae]GGC99598.1 hypothetical protein GCM10011512_28150 [Tersicoccus solisilvae]
MTGDGAGPPGPAIRQWVLRLNPGYEIRADAAAPDDAGAGADAYGQLVPRPGSGLAPRAISTETALLLLTLRTAGPVPGYAVRAAGPDLADDVRRLVLDGVLQVRDGAAFVHGPAALAALGLDPAAGAGADGPPDLAVAALRYAEQLIWLDEAALAQRLYTWGRQPVTPALVRRWGPPARVRDRLGLGGTGAVERRLGPGWSPVPAPGDRPAWWQWLRTTVSVRDPRSTAMTPKLYVSPTVDRVADVLPEVVALVAGTSGCTGFKVGAGVAGLCRPDKIVLYAARPEDLQALGWALAERIAGCPALPVPFTARVTGDGLLSAGVDPPAAWAGGPLRRTSWRMWLAERLAEHLKAAADAGDGAAPWRFALARMRLSGVDTTTWIPADTTWADP